MKSDRVIVSLTNRTIVRAILWVTATIVAFHLVGRVGHILTLIFVAFFLALALNPVVSWLSNRSKIKGRVQATSVAYLIVIAVLALFFALVTPPLVKQTRSFINEVPQLVDNFQNKDTGLAREVRKYNLDQKLSDSAKDFASNYGNFGTTIWNTGKRIAEMIASVLAVLVMTFMMLVEGPYWLGLFWGTVPASKRAHRQELAHKMYKGVSGFVNGQVIIALIAGFCAFVALEIAGHVIDVPVNAAALGGIVAVLGLIPLFGNPLSSTIVILVCLLNSLTLAIVMLIYFIVYFFVENHTFQPYVQSRLNKLTALSVFIAALLGVGLAGFLGAIVAIPAASAIKVLLEDHFKHNNPNAKIPAKRDTISAV
jgi:predicted PurR-regulated permease PerM